MSAYTVKVFKYPTETQIRFYNKAINTAKDADEEIIEKFKTQLKPFDKVKPKPKRSETIYNPFTDQIEELKPTEKEIAEKKAHTMISSKNRTINKIYEIARANMWEYFITLTFDPKKIDRFDYDVCVDALKKWLNNMKHNYAPDLKYLIVPELHKDGAYHFHGLIGNTGSIQFVDSGVRTRYHEVIYNIENYKLGFTTATKVKDSNKASGYLTKYITKDLCATTKGKKRYWQSYNLDKPIIEQILATKEEQKIILDSIQGQIVNTKGSLCPEAELSVMYVECRN